MGQFTRRTILKNVALRSKRRASRSGGRRYRINSPFQRPKLKITDIRTAQVMVHGPQTHVRVYTDSGPLRAGRIHRCRGGNGSRWCMAFAAC